MDVIGVKNVHKKFRVYYDRGQSLKERLLFRNRNYYEDRWVLRGINLEVAPGEAVGLIGENGCGKSTLLKLLTQIIYPDKGCIEINGRVSSLIELGAGFHPDMSGRENIYTNASIFGLTRKEIDQRLDDIIAFSELEEFIDNPVRTYSSGMYMRLAFSVAINVDADILLIDEILAVGDANFQSKCFDHLRELKASGVTIVIVSHDTGTIERFCDKAVWLNDGAIAKIGKSGQVVDAYLSFMNNKKIETFETEEHRKKEQGNLEYIESETKKIKKAEKKDSNDKNQDIVEDKKTEEELLYEQSMNYKVKHFGTGSAVITKARLLNKEGHETLVLRAGKNFSIEINYKVKNKLPEFVFGMGIYTMEGVWIFGTNTLLSKVSVPYKHDEGVVIFHGEEMELLTGKYILQISITDVNGTPLDFYREYCYFNVVNDKRDSGLVYMKNSWEL